MNSTKLLLVIDALVLSVDAVMFAAAGYRSGVVIALAAMCAIAYWYRKQ